VLRAAVVGAVAVMQVVGATGAFAQDMAQYDPLAKSYTLGRFQYKGPDADGWRQIANETANLQLVYVEQLEGGKFNTRCHVIFESADVPAAFGSPSAAALADASRREQRDKLKDQVAGASPVAAVPGAENVYTYRFLLHGPPELGSDYYQVYYVALAPDKSQYVVVQLNVLDQDYENQLYFQQFYGTLPNLKYQAAATPGAEDAAKRASEDAAKHVQKDAVGHDAAHDATHVGESAGAERAPAASHDAVIAPKE